MVRRNNIETKEKILWGIKRYLGAEGELFVNSLAQIESISDYVDEYGMQLEVVLNLMKWIGKKEDVGNPIAYLETILLDYVKKGILTLDDYQEHLERRKENGSGADTREGLAAEETEINQKGNRQKSDQQRRLTREEQLLKKLGKI